MPWNAYEYSFRKALRKLSPLLGNVFPELKRMLFCSLAVAWQAPTPLPKTSKSLSTYLHPPAEVLRMSRGKTQGNNVIS